MSVRSASGQGYWINVEGAGTLDTDVEEKLNPALALRVPESQDRSKKLGNNTAFS